MFYIWCCYPFLNMHNASDIVNLMRTLFAFCLSDKYTEFKVSNANYSRKTTKTFNAVWASLLWRLIGLNRLYIQSIALTYLIERLNDPLEGFLEQQCRDILHILHSLRKANALIWGGSVEVHTQAHFYRFCPEHDWRLRYNICKRYRSWSRTVSLVNLPQDCRPARYRSSWAEDTSYRGVLLHMMTNRLGHSIGRGAYTRKPKSCSKGPFFLTSRTLGNILPYWSLSSIGGTPCPFGEWSMPRRWIRNEL